MDGGNSTEGNIERASALKNCLVYLLQDAKDAELGWCALHLKIAISELNVVMGEGVGEASGSSGVSLCGHPAVNGCGPQH